MSFVVQKYFRRFLFVSFLRLQITVCVRYRAVSLESTVVPRSSVRLSVYLFLFRLLSPKFLPQI
jgi:hypothetical protein